MKRTLSYHVIFAVFFSVILIYSNSFAEPYQSSKFPSNDILEKNFLEAYATFVRPAPSEVEIVGKVEIQKDHYNVWAEVSTPRETSIRKFELVKLDTNVWILSFYGYTNQFIIQK